MTYVALLRGVNVGVSNRMDMKELKAAFEAAGMTCVRTYINSGNIVFKTDAADDARVAAALEAAIVERFGFRVRVLVRDIDEVRAVIEALPAEWANDEKTRCDVYFLWDAVDRPSILEEIPFDPEIEDVRYVPGAIISHIDRVNVTRGRLPKLIGTPLYRQMTIRNCNTARKLLELMSE
jgi:uncharacterized protein (DUF1697 family)